MRQKDGKVQNLPEENEKERCKSANVANLFYDVCQNMIFGTYHSEKKICSLYMH